MPDLLLTGPDNAAATLLFAHGAGAPMDSGWMNALAEALAVHDVRVARFEFAYMAARRAGQRKPPPRAESLVGEFGDAVAQVGAGRKLAVGGKSLGGRVASLIADELFAAGRITGLVCAGYPFHPPGQPDKLRTAHLGALSAPALICQGERDPFGTSGEVPGYRLAPAIAVHWLADGDHDFRPRKASGHTLPGNISEAAAAMARAMRDWG